jgi:hypothetical protein
MQVIVLSILIMGCIVGLGKGVIVVVRTFISGEESLEGQEESLSWECWIFKCQKWLIDRHVCVGPTCHQHVGDTTKNSVGQGTDNVKPKCCVRICWQHVDNNRHIEKVLDLSRHDLHRFR